MLVSSNSNALPPELMERKREIEADLKTMRESMTANAKDDVEVVSFKWSSIRTVKWHDSFLWYGTGTRIVVIL